MKLQKLIILTVLILVSCSNSTNQNSNDSESEKRLNVHKDTLEIFGLWAMTDYIDSILLNKTISKYSMQYPTWFAILIDIKEDTLRAYGSILDEETGYMFSNDTIYVFNETFNGDWTLTYNCKSKNLELRNTNSYEDTIDNKVYVYKKNPDLRFLLDTLDNVHKTSTSFTNFFNDKFFSGKYNIIYPKNKIEQNIIFSPDGTIKSKQFDRFKVYDYFGTCHLFKNKDVISISEKKGNESIWNRYNWQFKGDTLILTNFIQENKIAGGKEYTGNSYILGKKKIKMIKIE